jgi:hypothetical protein
VLDNGACDIASRGETAHHQAAQAGVLGLTDEKHRWRAIPLLTSLDALGSTWPCALGSVRSPGDVAATTDKPIGYHSRTGWPSNHGFLLDDSHVRAGVFAKRSVIAWQNAGRSSGERLVMRLPSMQTCWSTTVAPALRRSVRTLG